MPMFATAANDLEISFDAKNSIIFRMHADLNMDTLRWLRAQVKRLEMLGKRADKIEAKAVEEADTKQFEAMTGEAEAIRSKGGDELDVMVTYVQRACLGWTDYYADQSAMERGEPLPFDATNIQRIGVVKLAKIVTEFNRHYGLTEDTDQGKANAANLPEPSPSKNAAPVSQSGT